MLNQLDVQYDPKSTKPVLEQLLLQTINAQGYKGPKSSITKISEFVHNAVATKNEQNSNIATTEEPDLKFINEYNANIDDKLKAFMYFQPDDLKKFNETLIETRKRYREQNEINLNGLSDKTAQANNVQNREPYHTYYFNKFTHLQQFDDKLAQVHELHKNKIYKIAVDFGSIWQTTDSTHTKKGIRNDFSYHYYKPSLQNSHKNYPIIIRDDASLKLFKDRVHDMIHEDQSPLHQESNTRKVALYSFVIIVYELPLGTKLRPEVQWFNQHDYTRSIDCDYNICWFIAASFQLHPEINNNKSRIANAIELFLQFNDQVHKDGGRLSKQQKQLLKDYEGFNQDTDLEKFQQCFKLNIMTYEYDHSEKQFNKTNEYIVNQEWITSHFLLAPLSIQGDENPQVHAMFIKDIDRVVGGYLCKKCNQKLFNRSSAHFGRDLKTHIESCKGPDQQKHPKLDKLAQPFMPYLKQNKTIQKLFATGKTKLFPKDQEQGISDILQPTKNYMCIDAETVEDQAQDDESIYAQLLPLSIVIGTQINNKIQSKYIDNRSQDFMNQFIEQMWELANEVNEANLACEPVVKFDNENEQQKHQQKIHQVAIFGFNSKKFDFNILFPYLVQYPKIIFKSNAYLGSTTQQKQVTIRHTDYPFELVFKDVLTFIPPTTLDNFVHKYGNGTKLTEGKFPHGSFNTNNVDQFLSSSEPFKHEDFYNQISRKNISDKEYQEYVEDFISLDANGNSKFEDRWSYLEFYNIRDVECMFAPINNLIDLCWQQGIDMLSQISLSQIANSIKYNYAWEDFDINGDYNIETGNKEYKFYSEKWNKKIESYIQQDNKAGRDTTNNVTANDMDYFNELIPNKCCYCQAKFTSVNKPTLERIDNNIAHTKDNCKLACQLCNSTRSNKDADVAKLMIQMYKYAIVKNLPMTIDDEEVYWFLRKSIHGGLSQVFHQYNIKGLTHINKLKYNPEENNVTAYDLDYIITHILDLDFNSLYPSAFCGIYNKNNPYTGGKMYMAGRVTKHIKIRDANDQDYRDTKRKEMMNIINSKDRFSEEKGQLFIASVKGHIDKNYINEHINFPPIWRKRTYKTDENGQSVCLIVTYFYQVVDPRQALLLNIILGYQTRYGNK
ncbi:MAG: hypothetical protein EZS28_025681, partial [Streblomastix strix]